MSNEKIRLYKWAELLWDPNLIRDTYLNPIALCPKCKCKLELLKYADYDFFPWQYGCTNCDFKINLKKSIKDKADDFASFYNANNKYRDIEIVNIDGELIPVQSEKKQDSDYWARTKISENKKGEVQLMILAGSRKEKNKTQLFIDIENEKLSFDQNDDHPCEVFAKVTAVFKNSTSEMLTNES